MGAQPPKGGNGLDFGIAGVAAITVIAYIVGLAATGAHQAVKQMTCHENGTCGE